MGTRKPKLFKHPRSKYWYFTYTINGSRTTKSTGETSVAAAEKIRDDYLVQRDRSIIKRRWVDKKITDGDWLKQTLRLAKRRAKQSNREFNLTKGQLIELCHRSGGMCEVSGIPFTDETVNGSRRKPFAASLDRIDSHNGYTYHNCRLVCFAVNMAMGEWGEEVFTRVVKGVMYKRLRKELKYDD